MNKFEYKQELIDDSKFIEKLNYEGESGWELVQLFKKEFESWTACYCIFKRKIIS